MIVAIVKDGVVQSLPVLPQTAVIAGGGASASWPADTDGVDPITYQAPAGATLVLADGSVKPGYTYNGSVFAPPAATLGDAQAATKSAAAAHFAALIAGGFTSGGTLYALDPQSIANATAAGAQAGMVGLSAAGFTWPAGFTYPAADGSRHAMTAAQMATLANNLFHYVAGCDQKLAAIIASIAAAADVAAVNAIDVTAGYPAASA